MKHKRTVLLKLTKDYTSDSNTDSLESFYRKVALQSNQFEFLGSKATKDRASDETRIVGGGPILTLNT